MMDVAINHAGYEGRPDVIRDIRFKVDSGQLVGLIGQNGAGKSTTIKAVLGLLDHLDGNVQWPGNNRYAYIPEKPIWYEKLTLWEHLELAAAAFDIEDGYFRDEAERLLERFRLRDAKHLLPGGFSKGMQQKMMLVIGFLIQPAVYIIDEPFIGLDPRATKDFLDVLRLELDRGAGVLMSTHVLDTAERICDSFLLIDGGSLVASGTLEDIRKACGRPDATLLECFHELS